MAEESTLIAMKWFFYWGDPPVDGETVENIALLLTIDYFGGISISFYSISHVLKLKGDSVALFTANDMRFDHTLTY